MSEESALQNIDMVVTRDLTVRLEEALKPIYMLQGEEFEPPFRG